MGATSRLLTWSALTNSSFQHQVQFRYYLQLVSTTVEKKNDVKSFQTFHGLVGLVETKLCFFAEIILDIAFLHHLFNTLTPPS